MNSTSIEEIIQELTSDEQMCNISMFSFINRCLNEHGKKAHIIQSDVNFIIFRIVPLEDTNATN